jgi:pyrroline-5-carboxylate reductase
MNTIGFIGGGNMAESLIGGLIANGQEATSISVYDTDQSRLDQLGNNYAVRYQDSNQQLADTCDLLVMAVKPQVLKGIAASIREQVQANKPLVISIAAGVRSTSLEHWLGGDVPIVRVMPNTPALVGAGASGMFANHLVDEQMRDAAESLMRSVGLTIWLENESQIDIVTALSGSGPAYIFRVIEAMEEAATHAGLAEETSRLLAIETALGAARLAVEASDSPAQLRAKVTSPGGTTEQALKQLEQGNIGKLFDDAITAAIQRAAEMAEEFNDGED